MEPSRFVVGTARHSSLNNEQSLEFFKQCYELGLTTIDTGWGYGGKPHLEENRIREFLACVGRDKVHVIDKFPLWASILEGKSFQKVFEEQLESLGTDYIDTYLLHCPFEDSKIPLDFITETSRFLVSIQKEGKVRHIGFSAHVDYIHAEYLTHLAPWDSVMYTYNILTSPVSSLYSDIKVLPNPGKKGFELAKSLGMHTYSMMPYESGRVFEITNEKSFVKYARDFVKSEPLIDSILVGTSSIEKIKEFIDG